MSAKTKPCPNCGSVAHQKHDGKHQAGHGAHMTLHAYKHGHPVLAVLGLVGTAVSALGLLDRYKCDRCGHEF